MKTTMQILSIGTVIGLVIALPAVASAETYTYDAAGRLTVVTYDDGSTLTYTYDNAGNIIQQVPAAADTTPPSAPVLTGATATNNATPTWNWGSGGGGNGTYRYKLDDNDLTTGATETTATSFVPPGALSEADHTLYVQERDDAGNWSSSASFTTLIDLTAATTTASPVGGTYSSAQSVALSCDDGIGSGCAAIYFTTDGNDPTTSSTAYTAAISISVDTTLKFFSADNAGNSETISTESYIVQIVASNSPPAPFDLVYPANGQTDVPAPLKFIWKLSTDPDGDAVSYQLTYCENQDFSGCAPQTAALTLPRSVRYAGLGGPFALFAILVTLLIAGRGARAKNLTLALAFVTICAGVAACNGDKEAPDPGPGSVPRQPGADEKAFDVSGLVPGTTYYWKVTASDGNGGTTESATWMFATR